jgi:hypothetical protein
MGFQLRDRRRLPSKPLIFARHTFLTSQSQIASSNKREREEPIFQNQGTSCARVCKRGFDRGTLTWKNRSASFKTADLGFRLHWIFFRIHKALENLLELGVQMCDAARFYSLPSLPL